MILSTLLHFITVLIALSRAITLNGSESLDLRNRGLVGTVRNQEYCDAGWAFAILGLIEGQYAKKYGKLLEFSAQELIDCFFDCGCRYCDTETAIESLITLGGVEVEDDYPFAGKKQRCRFKPAISKVTVTHYNLRKLKSEEKLKDILENYGPVYVAIDGDALKGYSHGVLDNCPHKQTNHAVLLIGYGTENGVDYWLIKNSWGQSWGQQGFGKIRRGVNACGLKNGVLTATIDDDNLFIDPRIL